MELSTCIWDAQSGERLQTVEASAGTWQRGRVEMQSHVFPLRSMPIGRSRAHDLFGKNRPRDRVLSVLADGTPIYNGLIIDSDYDPSTGYLTVKHNDVRELAAGRWLFGIGGSNQTFTWQGRSWRGMASTVARIIFTEQISQAWPVRMLVPATDETGSESMVVDGFEFRSGESLLTEIEEMPGGPDIDFAPAFFEGRHGWIMRIGAPYLDGPTLDYNLQAAKSPLTGVNVSTIGAEKVTGVHGIGDGSEWDMIRGGAAAPESAGLARDTKLTVKNATLDVVNKRAAGYLASRAGTYQQWSFNVRADRLDVGSLRLGSIIRIESKRDDWIDDGWTRHRVLGFSGSLGDPNTINLTVETI